MVHRRSIQEEEITFGVQGALLGNAMTFWDHETGSVWSQPTGVAVAGPRKGDRLELLPVTFTSWASWQDEHPDTLALDTVAGITGFTLDRMAIVLDLAGDALAIPYSDLDRAGVINEVVGGLEVVAVVDPVDEDRWETFARRVDGQVLTFAVESGRLVDRETGTFWDPVRGIGLSGPLEGEFLGILPSFTIFPRDFSTFFPDGRIWEP
jgi:hypothetical protein